VTINPDENSYGENELQTPRATPQRMNPQPCGCQHPAMATSTPGHQVRETGRREWGATRQRLLVKMASPKPHSVERTGTLHRGEIFHVSTAPTKDGCCRRTCTTCCRRLPRPRHEPLPGCQPRLRQESGNG
jgi:hypothetical protein